MFGMAGGGHNEEARVTWAKQMAKRPVAGTTYSHYNYWLGKMF